MARSLLHLLPWTVDLLRFSVRHGAHRGFRDWNLNYERVFEYGEALEVLRRERPARILDVAGDISIFGCFVAERLGAEVDIVDLGDLDYCARLREHLDEATASRVRLLPRTRAEDLPRDRRYDAVVCISSIEHFEGDADLRFAESVGELLRPGGILVLTAPFTTLPETVMKYRDVTYYGTHGETQTDPGFFMRHYTPADVRRLAAATGLDDEKLLFAGEVLNVHDRVFGFVPTTQGSRPRRRLEEAIYHLLGAMSPAYPFLAMREATSPTRFRQAPRRRLPTNPDTFMLVQRRGMVPA